MNIFHTTGASAASFHSNTKITVFFPQHMLNHTLPLLTHSMTLGFVNQWQRVQGIVLWTNEKLAWMWCGWSVRQTLCQQLEMCEMFILRELVLKFCAGFFLFQCRLTRLRETSRPRSPPRTVSESLGIQRPEMLRDTKWLFIPLGMMLILGNYWLVPMTAQSF